MRGSYGELLRTPGGLAFTSAGLVARMPISQLGIATVLLVSTHSGSYGLAGTVAGVATLAGAVMMPQVARLVDRIGQAKVALPVVLFGAIGWILLSAAVTFGWPQWSWFGFALIGGGSAVSIGPLVRNRWTHLLTDRALRRRAFAWESSLDEVIFVTGPPLATFLATSIAPAAGVIGAVILLVGGAMLLLRQRATEPPPAPREHRISPLRLVSAAMLTVMAVHFAAGALFGSLDVIVIAFAEHQGQKVMAGLILGAYALGSLCSGLIFGLLHIKRSIGAQFVGAAVLCGVFAPLLLLASNLWLLALIGFVCGFAVAPMLISAALVIEHVVPPSALTEGLTWSTTAIALGLTVGAAVGGQLIDMVGARQAFLFPIGSGVAAAVIALLASPLLRGPRLRPRA